MGTGSQKQWQLLFAEIQGFSLAREQFGQFAFLEPRAHKHAKFSLSCLQVKTLGDLVDSEILLELGKGLWKLEVAGGTYHFIGAVESAPEMRFVAFAGYQGEDPGSLAFQIEVALESLRAHLSKEYQKNVFYGLAK
ncbi:MAG TPA: hypothetical protein VMH91_02235 [Candidatus Paceibacterota bacterium]|nr:hypothetical protein [Candidatus Paceibacterota bacterium]